MKTLVYMMRHGESVGNYHHQFLGHTDLPLTEKGICQAVLAGEYLKKNGISPSVVYASPLLRAYETARCATGADKPIACDGLREIYAGEWEGLLFDEIAERYPDAMGVWRTDLGNACPTGGESVKALAARVKDAVLSIAARHAGETVFIGTHATPIRTFEVYARGLDILSAKDIPWPTNASLSAYLCEGERVIPLFYSLDPYLGGQTTTLPKTI